MNTLIKLEITRTLRNKKFMFFSVIYPAALYLMIAGGASTSEVVEGTGLTLPLLMMVSMASFGAITAVLVGNSERIAKEREKGWVRQLRLTSLPGRGYVTAKVASAAVVSLPSILVVFVVAATVKDVRFDGVWQWFALTGVIWAGSIVFAALGVAVGYLATGDAVRPITFIIYFGLSMLGGLWMPTAVFPKWLQNIAEWVPTHAYAALGQAIEVGDAPHLKDVAILFVYLLLFSGAAAWLYRKDTHKA
ncbi:ABC transporter [Streptomyces cinnamoneus]|uniref:ABC transporter n=1 Tax=Streptomyces cinnamoneus TaxID=53446 RepID=A0A2G1XDU8_STRCJ|nr:ABC transporter permease [Streptomyces cinnamoneus]PHQ49392.1 ABC transporter [Streptomyces cinnamoneus]PPT14958.1 ABC transporter permease [Streptomyces cinnamoneus]